jgi:hypothetical protein
LISDNFRRAIEYALDRNGVVYTHAFILCANNAFGQGTKHLNHIELWRKMFISDNLAQDLLDAKSLIEIFRLLRKYPLMGDFMSYQTAIDLNYSDLINFSENDFTVAGPGALRGIAKCFESTGQYSPEEIIHWMIDNQADEFARLGLEFSGLFGRPLHAIDCQGLFCETDKYCRVAFPEVTSVRSKIKTRFHENSAELKLFFPPKWHLKY